MWIVHICSKLYCISVLAQNKCQKQNWAISIVHICSKLYCISMLAHNKFQKQIWAIWIQNWSISKHKNQGKQSICINMLYFWSLKTFQENSWALPYIQNVSSASLPVVDGIQYNCPYVDYNTWPSRNEACNRGSQHGEWILKALNNLAATRHTMEATRQTRNHLSYHIIGTQWRQPDKHSITRATIDFIWSLNHSTT